LKFDEVMTETKMHSFFETRCIDVTDGQTDGQNYYINIARQHCYADNMYGWSSFIVMFGDGRTSLSQVVDYQMAVDLTRVIEW